MSSFMQKFLAIYLLLKKKLNSFFFKIIFFKIIFLRGQKALVLVNVYKVIQPITNSNRRASGPFIKKVSPGKFVRKALVLSYPVDYEKKKIFKQFFLAKRYPVGDVWADLRRASQKKLHAGGFPLKRINLLSSGFSLERFLSKLLLSPVEVRLKNVFSSKKKQALSYKSSISPLSLSRVIYKKTRNF